jgi:hypothetical protein
METAMRPPQQREDGAAQRAASSVFRDLKETLAELGIDSNRVLMECAYIAFADIRNVVSWEYNNLMYCCEDCNSFKGPRCPPQEARDNNGFRFFRPDQDYRHEHFGRDERDPDKIKGISEVGEFNVDAIDLNRLNLQRLKHSITVGELP